MLLLAGLLVGSLDILAAFTDYYIATGKGPEGVLRYIASGVFGKEAFTGGSSMIFWGLFFHFVIAYSFTVLYYWLYPRVKFISKYPIITAFLYGIFMWIVTTKIVVPLSNVTSSSASFHFWKALKAVMILVVMISIPLTIIIRMHFKKWAIKSKTDPNQ